MQGSSLVDIICKKINNSSIIPKSNFYFSAYEEEIKSIVLSNNLQLFERSKKSAFSEGPMQEVMEYHDKLNYKYSVVINGCCPLLKIETIDKFIKTYKNSSYESMFSVIAKKNYFWNIDGELITKWPKNADVLNTKLVEAYEAAHCLYAGRLDTIKNGIWMAKPLSKKTAPHFLKFQNTKFLILTMNGNLIQLKHIYE